MTQATQASPQMQTHSPSRGWSDWLNRLGPLIGLLVVFAFFAAITDESFRSLRNIQTILRQGAVTGTAAMGMTLVIVMGGIDLSVGSIIALGTVVVAWTLQLSWGGQVLIEVYPIAWPLAALAAGVAAGAACGLFNGLAITRLKVTPFIVTLGSLLVVRGLAKWIAGEQKIDAPESWLIEMLASLRREHRWLLAPPGVWLMLAFAIVTALGLNFTRAGRHVVAIGSNEQTARLCGIAVDRVKVLVYCFMGAMAGMAGVMQFSRLTVGDPTVAQGLELDVIAAVVIGGGSLRGGEGSVFGALIGALIMMVIRSGCVQLGVANFVQEMVTGGIIITAVALDRFRHRRAA